MDNALIFCYADEGNIQSLRVVLLCFEVVSSLKVNLGKSKLVLVEKVGTLIFWQVFWVVKLHIFLCNI